MFLIPFLLILLFIPITFAAVICIFVYVIKSYREYSNLRAEIEYLTTHICEQEVKKFIIMVQSIKASKFSSQPYNNPPFFNSVRYTYGLVINSPQVSPALKQALFQVLSSRGVILGNRYGDAQNNEERNRESGKNGENTVQEWLKKLPSDKYISLHNLHIPYPEHSQEIDSIVIGPNCVFHIETKNYGGAAGGTLYIDASGRWNLIKPNGSSEEKENPTNQLRLHDAALKQYLKMAFPDRNIDVKGMIVISNPNTIIQGNENEPYVHSFNFMNKCIEDYTGPCVIDAELKNAICSKLSALKSSTQSQCSNFI